VCCIISVWMLLTVPLTYALLWLFREKIESGPAGICSVCGYDLRATPDRCPECGTVPPRRKPNDRASLFDRE
jgi:predicted amidophosphoribosyltransferase